MKALGKESVESTDPVDIQQMVNTNVTGMMQMTTVVSKQMVARSKGINTIANFCRGCYAAHTHSALLPNPRTTSLHSKTAVQNSYEYAWISHFFFLFRLCFCRILTCTEKFVCYFPRILCQLRGALLLTFSPPPRFFSFQGHIITLGSISGHYSYPGGSVYCATKFAVDGYMKGVQSDLGKTPVRVSVVSPGFVETEFSLVRFKGDADKAVRVSRSVCQLASVCNLLS